MELKPCDESTDEYIIFCAVMDTLENLCEKKFDLFQVVGFRKMASQESVPGDIYEVKIKTTEEGEDNVVHAKIWKPEGEEEAKVAAYKKGMKEADDFSWEDTDNVPGVLPEVNAGPQTIGISDKVN